MDKNICFAGGLGDVAGIIGFLYRVDLVVNASLGDCGELRDTLLPEIRLGSEHKTVFRWRGPIFRKEGFIFFVLQLI